MDRPIRVNAKTLAHISSGLYRTTAGALKELISNSFDANATVVGISTNKPSFDVFSCSDNGSGITLSQFETLMEGGIGFSTKRLEPEQLRYGRPVIGRLGIGMLAMTQLSHGFKVVSHHLASETAFEAEVMIRDFLPSMIDVESRVGEQAEIGTFRTQRIPFERSLAGLTIASSEMHSGLTRRFRESSKKDLPLRFGTLLTQLQRLQSISRQGPYWDLVFGLSLYAPVRYTKSGPVHRRKVLPGIKDDLASYNFEVTIDGMPLRKPFHFPHPADRQNNLEYFVRSFQFDEQVEGVRLAFSGYIFAQEGKSITPVELRGILIRIRNIAIGGLDKTFLDYEIAEGPRFGWLMGEIYATAGLEDALNVDRDSFNISHPHYLKVREVLHGELSEVFSQLYRGIDRRSRAKRDKLISERDKQLLSELSEVTGVNFTIESVGKLESDAPIVVDKDAGKIRLSEESDLPHKPDKRQFAEQLLIAWEIAAQEATIHSQRSVFFELAERILRNFKRW